MRICIYIYVTVCVRKLRMLQYLCICQIFLIFFVHVEVVYFGQVLVQVFIIC